MVQVKKYSLPPTALIPNSHNSVLHYPNILPSPRPTEVYDIFSSNGWKVQWVSRYGPTQQSHYHSATHECMAVLTGEATIRFGVADEPGANLEESTHGKGKEDGGVEVKARVGDVFVMPAGVAHKTFNPEPAEKFQLLTPGDAHHIPGDDVAKILEGVKLSGFTMIGAYPEGGKWDFAVGGEHTGKFEEVWNVPKPDRDPVLEANPAGLSGLWT